MDKLTMREAIERGLKRYFTGVSCPHGHIAERIVSTRACSECARERKHAWSAANPEKVNAQKRAYCRANPEKVKAWKSANQKLNRASANARSSRWEKAHPERVAEIKARRRAQMPPWADRVAIGMIYRAAQVMRTSGFDVHVDHVVPLFGESVRGLHVHNNLQIVQAIVNRSKSNIWKGN